MSRIAEALGEGYSYAEITAFLSNDKRVSAAKEEGYSDEDIVNFLRANESALDLKAKAEKDTPIIGGLLSQAEKKPSLIEGITGTEIKDSPRVVPTYTDTLKSTDAAAKAVPNAPITPTNTFADASRQTVTAQEIAKQGVKQDNAGKLRALESTRIDAPAEIDKPFLRGLGSATGDMIAGTVGAFGQVLDATGFGTPESVTKVYQNLKSRADSIRPEDVSKMGEMDQALYYMGSGLASSAGSILAIAQPELALPYLGFMGTTASGNKYQSLIEKGVSKPEAQANALITGTSEALTEMLGIKGGHRVMQYYAKLPLEARRQFTKRLLLGTGVMVMGATEEGTEELINKQVENATDILTGAFMQQTERGNQKTAGKLASTRIAEGSGEAFKGGAYGGLLFGAGGAFVADQQAVKPNSGSEVFRDQLAQQIDGAQFTNDASTIASDRLAPGNAQYTQAPSVTNQSMGNELLDMERTAPRATVDDIMAEDATVDDAIAAARNMVDTATADLDVADVVASVTQPEEMLDGRTDVGGQDAAMAAQGDEGAGVDVPGSGTDTQAGLLGGLAGGSGSAGSMATPAGVDSVAGDAGVQGLTRFAEPDVTNMNYDELSAYIDSANTHNLKLEEAAIRKHMGDDAASKYMAMNRRQRDSWWMNNATVDMDAEANSKEAGTVDTDTLQEIRSAINDFDIESPRDLGRSIAIPAKRAMENPGKRGAEYVQVRNALRYAAEQGWRMADVRAGMAERAVEWAGDDAAELFDKVFAPSQNPTRATTPTTPLPESGANQSVTQAVPASLPGERAAPINPAGESIAPQPTQPVTQESQTQSPQVASEGVAPAVVVTPAQQKVVDAVNASLVDEQAKLGDKAPPLQQLTVATPEQVTPAVRDALPLAQAFLEAAGYQHEMVVVAPTDDKTLDFDGAVASNGAGIVIAADSARTVPRVVVHEFGHEMRKEAPQVWETLAAEILGRTDKAAQLAHLKKRGYTGETLTPPMAEEFVNDVLSDMLNSGKEGPRILVDVASNMDKAEPGSGKEFLKRLLEFIDKVIKGMVGKGYGTEATILKGEVGAIRKAIAKALTDYNLQAKKAEKAKAAAEAAKAKQEAAAAKKAALAAEVARAKAKPVEPTPPADTKTDEVSDADGAKTDVFAGAPQAFLNRINKAVTNNVPLLVMRGSHVSGAEYTLYEPGNRSHLSADWKTLQGEDSGSDAVKVAMRYREKADIVYATPAAEAQMAEQAQAMADEKAKLDGERKAREDKANADADARQRLTDALAGAKFTKGEFTPVSDKPGAKLDPVSGMVHGGLIVHKSPGHFLKGQQYTISHVATGLAVLHGFKSQPSAKQAAARLSRLADMTKLTKKEDIQTKPFETFTEVAKAIKKNDGDPLAEPQIDAPTGDEPNGTDGPKRKKAGPKRSLRNVITKDTRDALVKGWTQIGGADTAFTYPRSESKSLGEIMMKVAPRLQVEHMPGDVDLTDGWLVFAKDADGKADRTRPGYVMQYKDGKVELNVAEWGEGNDGAALYAAVGNYAYNNGLLFAGDRMGISDTGRARRLENMISLALKYKTTRHIEPHVDMLVDFSWEKGNDNYNLGEMLAASYRLTAEAAPEIEDITYDPDTKEFAWVPTANRKSAGEPDATGAGTAGRYNANFDERGTRRVKPNIDAIALAARKRGGRLGRKTLVRAILSNTFARRAQADARTGERAGDVVVPEDVTDGVLYSKRESPEYRRAQAAGLDTSPAAVDARRKEQGWSDTVYYHGTRVDVDMLKGGLISLTENSSTAEEYASGGGGNRKNATQLWVSLDDNGDAVEVFEPDYDEGVYVGNLGTVIDEDQWRDMRGNGEIDSVRTGANIIPVRIRGKLLDLHHHGYDRNGIETNTQIKDVLGSLDPRGNRFASAIVSNAKKGDFDWGATKYQPHLAAWKDVLNPQLEALGYSGLSYHDDGHSTVAMFSAKNIRSTNAMYNPEFDEGSRLLFSKRVPLQHYGVPKTWGNGGTVMTPMDSAVYTLQDRHIELKRAVQEIRATGAQLDDKWDPYLTEELFHGRAASRAQEFIKSELEPLTKDLLGAGISIAELDDYLWARHAINRNEEMEKINPEQVDANGDRNGSGLTDAEAQAKLDALTPAQQAQLESFALRVDDMNAETRRLMVEYGLETQDTIDLWEGKYPTYVPLMRDVEDEGGVGSGAGYSTGGKTSKRAMGSDRPVENILANIANQRDKVINKGEKNRVAMAVYGAALLNPNPDFWGAVNPLKINDNTPANIAAIEKARLRQELTALGLPAASINNMVDRPTEKSIHPITGMVVRSVNPLYMTADNILSVRVNGEDRFVVFNPTSEKAVRAIAALKNLDVTDRTYADPIVENTMHAIGATTRYFAKVNTQYNPVFGAVNFARDVQGALLNLQSTELKGQQKEVLKDVYRLMKDAAKHGFRMEKLDPADLVLWKQMLLEGGTTGYRDLFKDGKERNEAIVNALDPKNWQGTKWGKVLTANGYLPLANTEQLLLDKGNGIVKLLSDYNETMENVVRLAVFKAAIDHGLSGAKAASLSKNITTNFNRRGSIGQQAGQLFAFFNAAVQGTARIGETLIDRRPDGKYRISEAGKAIVSGGLIVGMLQPLLLALAGYGDDEPPEFVRDRNLIIPLWSKDTGLGYVTIPMPLGYHVIPGMTRIPMEAIMQGKAPKDVLWRMMGMFMEAFNPLGGSSSLTLMVSPTVTDPFFSLDLNKDWNGRPIYQESFSDLNESPGHTRAKDNSTELGYGISYAINWLSGGDKYQAGEWSPTPDAVEYMIGQLTGGVGREVMKAWRSGKALATGEAVPTHQIPLVARFYGRSDGKSGEGPKFYTNLKYFNELRREKLERIEEKDDVSGFKMKNPDHVLIDAVMDARRDVNKLRKHKAELVEKGASRERIRLIDDKITGRMARINKKIEDRRDRMED